MSNLKTQAGRLSAIKAIEDSFLKILRERGFDISTNAVCKVCRNSIDLGIAAKGEDARKGWKIAFASEITIYAAEPEDSIFGRKDNEINFGSSGSFNPSAKEPYWRTLHAATILQNWAFASIVVNTHCKMYADLEKQIYEQNKKEVLK